MFEVLLFLIVVIGIAFVGYTIGYGLGYDKGIAIFKKDLKKRVRRPVIK